MIRILSDTRILKSLTGLFAACIIPVTLLAQASKPEILFKVSFPDPAAHSYRVELNFRNWKGDSLVLKLPNWMPGYYQYMNYSDGLEDFIARNKEGKALPYVKTASNAWKVAANDAHELLISYRIRTNRQFVANSYVDADHAYIIPTASFLYPEDLLSVPVTVSFDYPQSWKKLATGLESVANKPQTYQAPDFDILYDCPVLIGELEELPSFSVQGIEHRFIGYKMGRFDKAGLMNKLKALVEAAVGIIGDIPYKQYTFIGIGPGRGGIEHLNNTTVSFDGSQLGSPKAMEGMLFFLAHEYFHHYNVKRIRPFELGPFDYDRGSKTNLLWVSEGLSVYYEYLVVQRAGLIEDSTLLQAFNNNINGYENNPGRFYQSLVQSSYNTWKDGPFGAQGEEKGKTISYYEKGPVVGLLLDMGIRNLTGNKKSLDDVMRELYWHYYKQENRGFTDAEFRQACETVAGTSLADLFEYVYTTKELNYNLYLQPAGLQLVPSPDNMKEGERKKYFLQKIAHPDPAQEAILNSWLGKN